MKRRFEKRRQARMFYADYIAMKRQKDLAERCWFLAAMTSWVQQGFPMVRSVGLRLWVPKEPF